MPTCPDQQLSTRCEHYVASGEPAPRDPQRPGGHVGSRDVAASCLPGLSLRVPPRSPTSRISGRYSYRPLVAPMGNPRLRVPPTLRRVATEPAHESGAWVSTSTVQG
jgi:hypothetical protein